MYDNLEDYIHDENCSNRNGSSDDVSLSTNEFGHVDNVDGVTCEGTPPYEESEQETDLNPECVTIISMESQPDCSENIEKVTNECYYQTPQGTVVANNEVPQPVSKCVTLSLIQLVKMNKKASSYN